MVFRGDSVRSFLLFFALTLLYSCAKSKPQEVAEAIDVAQTYLSERKCQAAIDILENQGNQNSNPDFVQVLASAYACKSNYDEINFIGTDIPNINAAGASFLQSLSILSKSYESQADSSNYTGLLQAINLILNSDGGAQPSQAARNAKYGTRKAGDLGLQALYMSIVQLGKFLNFYGNVDAAGNKGAGAPNVDEQGATASSCFITYSYATAIAYLQGPGAPGGACDDLNTDIGHPNLSLAGGSLTTTKRRMCEGLVLITNIIDILNNVTLSSNTSLGQLSSVTATANSFKSTAIAVDPTLQTLLDTTSQATCESIVSVNAEFDRLQFIYALLFETGLP